MVAACFLNPSGIHGALYPYALLKTTNFPVNENLSVLTLVSLGAPIELSSILSATLFLWLSLALAKSMGRFATPLFLLGLASTVLAWGMYRNHPLLGFLSLSITAVNVGVSGLAKHRITAGFLGLGVAAGIYINASQMVQERAAFGLGWTTQQDGAAKFLAANHLEDRY